MSDRSGTIVDSKVVSAPGDRVVETVSVLSKEAAKALETAGHVPPLTTLDRLLRCIDDLEAASNAPELAEVSNEIESMAERLSSFAYHLKKQAQR